MSKVVECTYRVCGCGDNHVSELGLIDSEVYCRCAKCGKLKVACGKENDCNAVVKGEK